MITRELSPVQRIGQLFSSNFSELKNRSDQIRAWESVMSRYAACENFDVTGWYRELRARRLVRSLARELTATDSIETTKEDIEDTKSLVEHHFQQPLGAYEDDEAEFLAGILTIRKQKYPPVSDVTVWEAYRTRFDFKHCVTPPLSEHEAACKKYIQIHPSVTSHGIEALSSEFQSDEKKLLEASYFKEVSKESEFPLSARMVNINLSYSDNALREAFNDWLKACRRESNELRRANPFTENDLSNWVKYKVLQFIDIRIACEYLGIPIIERNMDALHWSDVAEILNFDEGSLRKTYAPEADRLLDGGKYWAIQAEAKQRGNIHE